METIRRDSFEDRGAVYGSAFADALTSEVLHQQAPAVFASSPHERTSPAYTFISTERLLDGLRQAGFAPVEVRQARSRTANLMHAAHVLRLRRRYETVQLRDAIPEIVFLNSHDGRSAYHLKFGLFRAVCTNGLIVSAGSFGALRVPHRGNVVDDVIRGAIEMSERFGDLGERVQQMERKRLDDTERLQFAERALALRYSDPMRGGMQPSHLLTIRRPQDDGRDLWRTYNVVQENLLHGGLSRRSSNGRLTRTRRIISIRTDIGLNTRLWDLATEVLAN